MSARLDFHLPPRSRPTSRPRPGGADRSDVRLMVSEGLAAPRHPGSPICPPCLRPGDVLVVNTSATLAAAVCGDLPSIGAVVVHFSTELGHGPLGRRAAPAIGHGHRPR